MHLQATGFIGWRRNIIEDGIKQYADIFGGLFPVGRHPALLGRTKNCREIELFICGIQAHHQFEYSFLHIIGGTVGFVNFVYNNNGF